MVLRGSALSHRAANETLPLRDAFAVLFFVSVGMLFDPRILVTEPLRVLAVLAIILVGKSVAAAGLVLALRYPLGTALTVSAGLAQIGEFSFILAGLGVHLGLLPAEGQDLILAGALLSIALNPLVFSAIDPLTAWLRDRNPRARSLAEPVDPLAMLPDSVGSEQLTGHVLIAGYGRVGSRIGRALAAQGIPFVVAEEDRDVVESLRSRGAHAVVGDAAEPGVLVQAHVARAAILVIAIPDAARALRMIEIARMLNPGIRTVVRTHDDEDAARFARERADAVVHGEGELAQGMIRPILGFLR
jgi:CPA2 family monovalent cation:H+ antiporter-2